MFCVRVTFLQDASPSRAESAIWTNARRERIRSVIVHCPAWWQAAPMAARFAELLPWLIMRYLGEISYTEDRLRGADGPGLAVVLRKAESNLCSALWFLGAGRELKIILGAVRGAECS